MDKEILDKLVDNLIETNEKNVELLGRISNKQDYFTNEVDYIKKNHEKEFELVNKCQFETLEILKELKIKFETLSDNSSFVKKIVTAITIALPFLTALSAYLIQILTK